MLKYALLLFRHFFLLACLKRNPQDLPASDVLLAVMIILYLLIGSFHNSLHDTFYRSFMIGTLDVLFMFLFVYLVLKMFNHQKRWTQTVTALAGSGIILTLVALPVSMGLIRYETGGIYTLFAMLMLGILIWSLCVHAHVFRHALDMPFNGGFMLSFVYNLLSFMVIGTLVQIQGTG